MLEDGFTLEGKSFTGDFETGGEVIFTTGMTGYQEVLTDPSYYGQMVCMTYPLVGNYGICEADMESARVHCSAFLVKECCKQPSNWQSVMALPAFLQKYGTPGMEGAGHPRPYPPFARNGAMRGMMPGKELNPAALKEKVLAQPTMKGATLCPLWLRRNPTHGLTTSRKRSLLVRMARMRGAAPVCCWCTITASSGTFCAVCAGAGFEPLAVPPNFNHARSRPSGAKGVFFPTAPATRQP